MSQLRPPIFILGGTRSGTTMLVRMLASAPDVCCLFEPRTMWRIGHAYRDSDIANEKDAKPWVTQRIRKLMLKFQDENDGKRIIEKNPVNIVRIPFLKAIFPDALFVHIYRDGRANLRSQVEQFDEFEAHTISDPKVRRFMIDQLLQAPWWEWPAYFPRVAKGIATRMIKGQPNTWFGLRYEGWRADRKNLSTAAIAAKQWTIAIDSAFNDLERLPSDTWLNLRYEDVVSDPVKWFTTITKFCNIQIDDAYLEMVRNKVFQSSVDRWRDELDEETLAEAMPILEPTLKKLDYPLM